jgi:hypothetical protein
MRNDGSLIFNDRFVGSNELTDGFRQSDSPEMKPPPFGIVMLQHCHCGTFIMAIAAFVSFIVKPWRRPHSKLILGFGVLTAAYMKGLSQLPENHFRTSQRTNSRSQRNNCPK